jgi:cytochrome c biogenesis protein CcdA
MSQLDLERLSEKFNINLVPVENSQERASRIRQAEADAKTRRGLEEADARFRRWGKAALFLAGLLMVLAVFVLCVLIVTHSTSPDDRKWATGILATIVSGLVGFLTGRATK